MAKEYIERKPILKFIEDGLNNPDKSKAFGHDAIEIMTEVQYAPTADVVEVVRCKDCKSRHDSCFAGVGNTYCDVHHKYFPLDGFCSYGEKRDSDGNEENL